MKNLAHIASAIAEAMTAPRPREQHRPPSPPRRGGRPSPSTASAAGPLAALARYALVAVACLGLPGALALPVPAQAQSCTLNTGDLWCGVVTVGEIQNVVLDVIAAYGFVGTTGDLSDNDGDKTFTIGTNSYTINRATVGTAHVGAAGYLRFGLTSALTATDQEKLVLHVGSASFALNHRPPTANEYSWPSTGLDWSSESTVTLRLREIVVPGRPTDLEASAGGREVDGRQVDLSWTAPADNGGSPITGYRIEASTDGTSWSDLVADTETTNTSFSYTTLNTGTMHYRVSAINAIGTSNPSATATVEAVPPPRPCRWR